MLNSSLARCANSYPGFVSTGLIDRLMGTAKGLYAIPGTIARYVLVPIINLFSISPDVAGERGMWRLQLHYVLEYVLIHFMS